MECKEKIIRIGSPAGLRQLHEMNVKAINAKYTIMKNFAAKTDFSFPAITANVLTPVFASFSMSWT
mgnify:CR=1 FL=1